MFRKINFETKGQVKIQAAIEIEVGMEGDRGSKRQISIGQPPPK